MGRKMGLAALFLLAALAAAGCPQPAAPPAAWTPEILPGERAAGSIAARADEEGWLLAVDRRGGGIGAAAVRPGPGGWPAGLRLRFDLGGLESLSVDDGAVSLHASWSTSAGRLLPTEARRRGEAGSRELPEGDPLSLVIERRGEGENRYFLVRLPAALLAARPAELRLGWIDFYR